MPIENVLQSILNASLVDELGLDVDGLIVLVSVSDRLLLSLGLSRSSLLLLGRRGLLLVLLSLTSFG